MAPSLFWFVWKYGTLNPLWHLAIISFPMKITIWRCPKSWGYPWSSIYRWIFFWNQPAIGDPPFIETPFWGISQVATEQHFDLRAGMSATWRTSGLPLFHYVRTRETSSVYLATYLFTYSTFFLVVATCWVKNIQVAFPNFCWIKTLIFDSAMLRPNVWLAESLQVIRLPM